MSHLKSYVGSIVLAALLLQGCGSSSDESTATQTNDSAQDVKTAATISALTDTVATLDATSTQDEVDTAFRALKLELSAPESSTTATAMQTAGLLETVAGGLANVLDSSLGDTITTAAFDVVLNSEGVTVVMIDLARDSEGVSEIMINAMEADWSLSAKMCPMLRTSTEFGEKFTALADEQDAVGRFFFERIDANMYNCLADAMLLSNNDEVHDESVSYSTNGYMGKMMEKYAADYFITPDANATADRRNDKFISLLLDTGDKVDYNSTTKTFEGHGDANELTNEKFFYSLFKTPNTTNSFIAAMEQVDVTTRTMLMDNIFLGQPNGEGEADKGQGNLNIVSIGSSMYDGIYGVADANGTRSGEYGFASYAGAFVGFAGLIPSDRYMTYARAFVGAGYQYADFHGINVWSGAASAAKVAWDAYTTPAEETTLANTDTNTTDALGAPARSAGLGITGSDWYDDITDLLFTAYTNFNITFNLGDLYDAVVDSNKTISAEITNQLNGLKDEGSIAYRTIIDGRDENNVTEYPTVINDGLDSIYDSQTVYGLHGLLELAMQEDIYYVECGNRSTDYYGLTAPTCDKNASYTMSDANASFQLPQFSELTWSFAYGTAKDGAMSYYSTNVNAEWFANLSSNELVRQYFYPSADNVYIPSWLLAIDWLKATDNFNNATIAETDLNFNSGYFDIYVTSTNPSLLTDTLDENNNTVFADIDLATVAGLIKKIEISRLEMGNDGIIAIGADGTNLDGLYVYKVRTITPEDTQAVLTALSTTYSNVTEYALGAIGLDSSNAANVDTTDVTDTNSTNTLASAQ